MSKCEWSALPGCLQDGQPTYTISQASIPEFEADDGSTVPGYEGLIVYSESEEHGVLQLED
nr:hypothetical protein [Klebsiella variicola]